MPAGFIVFEDKSLVVNQKFVISWLEKSTIMDPGMRLQKSLISGESFPKHLQLTNYFGDSPKLDQPIDKF